MFLCAFPAIYLAKRNIRKKGMLELHEQVIPRHILLNKTYYVVIMHDF